MRNDGKDSEEFVRVALKDLQRTKKCQFNRLYDTTSARGSFIPAQLADFCGTFEGVSLAIEVKSSVVHRSFSTIDKTALREQQVALMRLHVRAGGIALYVFHDVKQDHWEVWEGWRVLQWYITPRGDRPEPEYKLGSCYGHIRLQDLLKDCFYTFRRNK